MNHSDYSRLSRSQAAFLFFFLLSLSRLSARPLMFPPSCSFGVRPLPKRQMVLKLKEIHQYTHQLTSSEEEEEEEGPLGRAASCARFKEPTAPAAAASPARTDREEAGDRLSASQGSNASSSSTAASDESERCVEG